MRNRRGRVRLVFGIRDVPGRQHDRGKVEFAAGGAFAALRTFFSLRTFFALRTVFGARPFFGAGTLFALRTKTSFWFSACMSRDPAI